MGVKLNNRAIGLPKLAAKLRFSSILSINIKSGQPRPGGQPATRTPDTSYRLFVIAGPVGCRASVMRLRAQRREVLPNIWASLRSDNGLPVSMLVRYAAAAAALISSSLTSEALESWAAMLQSAVIWLAARYVWPGSFRSGSLARSASLVWPIAGRSQWSAATRPPDPFRCMGESNGTAIGTSRSVAAWWSAGLTGPVRRFPANRGAGCGGPDDPQD